MTGSSIRLLLVNENILKVKNEEITYKSQEYLVPCQTSSMDL